MKKTLLAMVQSILASMDSENCNSINDSEESLQVAGFIKDSYFEILSGLDLPETFGLFQLDASGDSSKPTLMTLPSGWNSVQWLKYNKQISGGNPDFNQLTFLQTEDFFERMFMLANGSDTLNDVGSYVISNSDGSDFTIYYRNDRSPCYYTSFDDHTYIFDSYDAVVDTTLQSDKTFCWGEQTQVWLMEDDFIPNLNAREFSLLENEAKQQAFVEAKQSSNPVASQRAHKGWVRAKRIKSNVGYNVNSKQRTTVSGFGRNSWPSNYR